ncbi:MarR family winged helix-turn-helix transcriptional regulator [Nucisporomicrobium flavum]|jgi:DNA-binding MarR family transcriptional regulator|uniref:MarR family winged helix-turn-helix transcriptional regulator n=1 Tax=Nucisporomicrobium flavum TaxID=2785915 RepID=UPI0018F531D8|nr:MarR family transcriptional regulator [Nucisporomicrobium flavum]
MEEPRWLDAEELQTWYTLAGLLVRLPSALDAQLQRDAGISLFEYQTMASLSEAPERSMRMSHLAMLAEGSLPRMSQAVGRLEKRGWVRRTPDPTDGRFTLAILTEAGWEKVRETAPGHVEATRTYVFDPLTRAQARQLTEISRRILRAVDPESRCPGERPAID